MTDVYLVRHGETDWNRAGRIQGRTDVPLNEAGRKQMLATGRLLAHRADSGSPFGGIYTSPLLRAAESAAIMARELSLPDPVPMPAITERDYGQAEGLDYRELAERFPDDVPVPGRESREEVAARAIPAIIALAHEHPAEALILVSHGGVIRTLLGSVAPNDSSHLGAAIRNGSVHHLHVGQGSLRLVRFDDPIEEASAALSDDDLGDQNPLERRESYPRA